MIGANNKGPSTSEQAAVWVAAIDRGLSEAERVEFEAWVAQPGNHAELERFGALWDELTHLSALHAQPPLPAAVRTQHWHVGAALAVLVLTLAVLWWQLPSKTVDLALEQHPAAETAAVYHQVMETAVGQRQEWPLPDGSRISINTNSVVEVDYSARKREIRLVRGEAFFEVAHDSSRPFNVHADSRTVRAVGTAFSVRLHNAAGIEVTVSEGKVQVFSSAAAPAGKSVADDASAAPALGQTLVSANETITIPQHAVSVPAVKHLDTSELEQRLAWQQGLLIFRGEPLTSVLAEVGRYTDFSFMISDRSLESIRVAGYFRAGDTVGLLAALEQNFAIAAISHSNGVIELRRP